MRNVAVATAVQNHFATRSKGQQCVCLLTLAAVAALLASCGFLHVSQVCYPGYKIAQPYPTTKNETGAREFAKYGGLQGEDLILMKWSKCELAAYCAASRASARVGRQGTRSLPYPKGTHRGRRTEGNRRGAAQDAGEALALCFGSSNNTVSSATTVFKPKCFHSFRVKCIQNLKAFGASYSSVGR